MPVINWFFTLRNNGTVASGPFRIELIPDTGLQPSASVQVPSLDPQQEQRYQLNNRYMTAGEKHWTVRVDSPNQVQESNEGNNTASGSVTVQIAGPAPTATPAGKPDLVIRELKLIPGTIKPGAALAVEFKVVNDGNAQAGPSKAEWKTPPGGGLSRNCDVPALAPGLAYKCSLSFTAGPNQAKIYGTTATADIGNTVAEKNEGNNQATATLTVKN